MCANVIHLSTEKKGTRRFRDNQICKKLDKSDKFQVSSSDEHMVLSPAIRV